jgi:hypothetical protein
MQAAELFRKKTGLLISIKCMYHDRNCDPLDPSDPIRSALPLPKELTVEVQGLL